MEPLVVAFCDTAERGNCGVGKRVCAIELHSRMRAPILILVEVMDGQILVASLEQSHDFLLGVVKLLHEIEIAATGELPPLARPIVPIFVSGWPFSAAEVIGDIDITEALSFAIYGAAEQSNFIHEIAKLRTGIDLGDPFQKLGNNVVDLRTV